MGRVIRSLFTTGAATIVSMAINLLLTPFITTEMGVDAYGFISLSNTLVGYAAILTTALDSYATRFIAVEFHRGDINKASGYYSSLFVANLFIGVVVTFLVIPVCISPATFLEVPGALVEDVGFLLLLTFVNFTISTMSTALSTSVYIKNRLDVYGLIQFAANLVEAVFLLALYWLLPAKLSLFDVALVISSLVLLAGNFGLHRKLIPELRLDFRLFSFLLLKDLFAAGVWSSINTLGNLLNSGIGLLIANLLLDATAMGQLAISKTFSSVLTRLYQLVSQAFYPKILKSYSDEDYKGLLGILSMSASMTGSLAAILFAGFFALCPAFYRLWVPDQALEVLFPLTMLSMVYSFAEGAMQPLYYIYALTLKNRFPTIVTLIGGTANIVATFLLIRFTELGVFSIPIASGLVMVFISFISNPLYMARCLKLPWYSFYPVTIRSVVACVVCSALFSGIASFMNPQSWLSFILSVCVCLAFGLLVCGIFSLPSLMRLKVRT